MNLGPGWQYLEIVNFLSAPSLAPRLRQTPFPPMKSLFLLLVSLTVLRVAHSAEPAPFVAHVPATAPRTTILSGRAEAFRAYCLNGDGARAFGKIRNDLDREFLRMPFPDEPITYGDPSPSKRDSNQADQWRAVQDICGRVAGIAEAATLCWLVTGEEKYFIKAREFLLESSTWHFAPDWKSGPVVGATDIYYNDEAHFRLWRKMPLVYDQLRTKLTAEERAIILAHLKERGTRSAAWIEREGRISQVRRNSIESDVSSHPVRFMPMTGLAGIALWDDLPEARDWWRYAYTFYRDQFTPFGGDDGGWAEGLAYWRGTFEHAAFQDALLALGDALAYGSAFWRNSPLFAVYNVQPYLHTTFGDVSNAGHFNLEPVIADYFEHVARVQQNGYFRSYAELVTDQRPRPIEMGLAGLDRTYPTATEFLIRNFLVSDRPLPPRRPLGELPPSRFFRDVGWVSLHSALGRPTDDIHVTFKSSPYGSFSHSHADQNGFVLNAYGEGLAINSAYREFHNSPHHEQWTRLTKSKNALLIDGVGQKPKDKKSTGKITRFETEPRYVWSTGDATAAYQAGQEEKGRVRRVTRDLVFVDQRYVIIRDRVSLARAGRISWLLHAEKNLKWDPATSTALIRGTNATLTARLLASNVAWRGEVTEHFPVPVDPKYVKATAGASYITGTWHNQAHLTAETTEAASEFTVYAVLWPERGPQPPRVTCTLKDGVLTLVRPDRKTDKVTLDDQTLLIR